MLQMLEQYQLKMLALDKLRDRLRREEKKRRQLRNRVATFSFIVLTVLTSFAFCQWHDAQKDSINILAETSEAFLLANRQLEATVTTRHLGRQIKNAILFQDAAASQIASTVLQRAVYNVQEHNLLEGHSRPISSVVFSPDGKTLASSDYARLFLNSSQRRIYNDGVGFPTQRNACDSSGDFHRACSKLDC